MKQETIEKAAAQYGIGQPKIDNLGEGIIHRTYKVEYSDGREVVLQCLNQNTFPQPENIINNYRLILDYMERSATVKVMLPPLLKTLHGKYYWVDEFGNFWRATAFIFNSYSVDAAGDPRQAYLAAQCFGNFTRSLGAMDVEELSSVIARFHDLSLRYRQFEDAVAKGMMKRLLRATHVIAELRQRYHYVEFYKNIILHDSFPRRVMHHDCKVSNVLFDNVTHEPICPVDLDTVMPGYYFSDLGDMIRTMTCTLSENETAWEKIGVNPNLYRSVMEGYLQGMGSVLTPVELEHIHHSGLIMTYMQALRFVADYLNNDIYYKTTYQEQNLNRALNQLILLERLEEHVQSEFNYKLRAVLK